MPEQGNGGFGTNEPVTAQWSELTHGNPVARHDEGVTLVEAAHDLAALVPQLALGDLP